MAKSTQQRVQEHFNLCISDDSHLILVAQTADGEITGYCAVHWLPYLILAGPEGYISELFIKEEFRGQGIGNNLLEAIKVEAQNRGCSRLMLLNIRHRDSYKRQFYSKHGWEERPDAANFVFQLIPRAQQNALGACQDNALHTAELGKQIQTEDGIKSSVNLKNEKLPDKTKPAH